MTEPRHLVPETAAAAAQPVGRFPFAFGPRFIILLLVGLVWIGPAWYQPRFLWAMAAWDALLLVLWLADLARLPRPAQLEVRRRWHSAVGLRMAAEVEIEIHNRARQPILAQATDDAPASLRAEPATVEFRVPGADAAGAKYPIEPGERGDAKFGAVSLRYQSPLRIAERWARADVQQVVRVYPNLDEAKRQTIYLLRSRQIELEKRLKRQRGRGREFESLRDYRDGDEWRDVSWTATARRGKLITKVFQIERSQTVWLVIDAGRLLRARVGGLTKLDYAVNAALSMAQVALYSGDKVGLLAYGRKPQQLLGPGRSGAHLRALIECLAMIRAEPGEADHLRAAHTLLSVQKWRSLLVWITDVAETVSTPEAVEIASRMRSSHLLLFGVMGQPELAALADSRPENATEMYRRAAGQEVTQRRDLLLRRLRERGALAVEMEPNALAVNLVNEYLFVKERSLL